MTQVYAVGYDAKDATTSPDIDDVVTKIAGATINIGSLVAASTADTGGQTVIECTSTLATAQLMEGVYTGVGGTGAIATATQVTNGLSGRAAATGDVIRIVKRGIAKMRFAAAVLTSAVTFGTVKLAPHGTTAGWAQEATAGSPIIGNLWQTLTGGGTTTGTEVIITAKVNFR